MLGCGRSGSGGGLRLRVLGWLVGRFGLRSSGAGGWRSRGMELEDGAACGSLLVCVSGLGN